MILLLLHLAFLPCLNPTLVNFKLLRLRFKTLITLNCENQLVLRKGRRDMLYEVPETFLGTAMAIPYIFIIDSPHVKRLGIERHLEMIHNYA